MGEYSDTILNQISKNHQEVVFLSDMLNNNKNDLTVFLGQAIQDAKEANSLAQEAVENSKKASDDAKVAYEKSVTAMDNSVVAEDNMLNARRIIQGEEKRKFLSHQISMILFLNLIHMSLLQYLEISQLRLKRLMMPRQRKLIRAKTQIRLM